MNAPDRIPDILRNALSVDAIEQSEPERFVFSEKRERNAKNGTDKKALAHKQLTHTVLKKLNQCTISVQPLGHDEHCFRLRREADIDEYEYRIAHSPRCVISRSAPMNGSTNRR